MDLKQQWTVRLNDREVAKLPLDENQMVTYWPLPAGALRDGANDLRIACSGGAASDDILLGVLDPFPGHPELQSIGCHATDTLNPAA